MRVQQHPVLTFERGARITFLFDGQPVEAYEGETIVAALHAAGIWKLSESPAKHRPRGLFCAIGHCSSCLMTVDGVPNVRTCVTRARQGMVVVSQQPRGDLG
ncbi:MAG TPA: (2Fe-2S)-binding protein [Thermotogota bacterium]|nr:(2Fe-2S)-binding protein [Thermotogota bacterium]HRW92869.1 (2Fe-2S)-binding protein [Thermotogota bacterium]